MNPATCVCCVCGAEPRDLPADADLVVEFPTATLCRSCIEDSGMQAAYGDQYRRRAAASVVGVVLAVAGCIAMLTGAGIAGGHAGPQHVPSSIAAANF